MKSRFPSATADRSGGKTSDEHESHPVLKIGEEFYVLASSQASRRITRVLAGQQSFAVFDDGGDIMESPLEALGFFHRDTRYLSRFELRVGGKPPYLLNSYLSDDKTQLRVNLTNPDLVVHGALELPRNSIQVERGWVLADPALFHRVIVRNFSRSPVEMLLEFLFGADFADVFEVRGVRRKHHGEFSKPEVGRNRVRLHYKGLDGVDRSTEVAFDHTPRELHRGRAVFHVALEPDRTISLETRIAAMAEHESNRVRHQHPANFERAAAGRRSEVSGSRSRWAKIASSDGLFDAMLQRSAADLTSIITHNGRDAFIMAGIPWFATLFGRDSILTAMSVLPFNPEIAAGTLRTLAALQGSQADQSRDEQPGKIVHEIRSGEMAATGEVPFGRYYGSVDSTPLFLWLLARYVAATGNLKLAEELWPNAEQALEWIERWGDSDGDGYVEYLRETPRGLANQGWKDSFDAISHADGELAHPPIALAEVQAYVYAAYNGIAEVASLLERLDVAERLRERSEILRKNFSRDFWLEEEKTVALALDAEKRPCRVMASNAAHCMAASLLDHDQARALIHRLMSDDMYSGWGVRTLSANERRYNPISYHNGSVWPHDNAIVAMGLGRYGDRAGVLRILQGLLDAATHLDSGSLPELFCGFPREQKLGPVPYPVACRPQAWSAASVLMIVQAMLGMEVMGFERRVVLDMPAMPAWLDSIAIEDLKVGDASLSFIVRRTTKGPAVEVTNKRGHAVLEIKE